MADRYWVGGTGTWDTTSTSKWSATSGGASGASVPTAADNVFFDASSNTGTGAFTVTIGAAVVCNSLDSTAVDGVMTLAGFSGISVSGSMTLNATNVWSLSGAITFKGTTSGLTITTNGVVMGSSIVIAPTGSGAYSLGSAYTSGSSRTLNFSSGTFSTNNYAVTVGGVDLAYGATSSRTANLGSSTITVIGSSGWSVITTSGLTLNAGTSTINLSNSLATHYFGGTGLTYYDINVSYVDSTYIGLIRDSVSCRNFSFTAITSALSSGARSIELIAGRTLTCSGTFSCPASVNRASRTRIGVVSSGTFYASARLTISAATYSVNDINFFGVACTGAGAPATGTSICDQGRNTGVTFTTAKTVYKVAASSAWINSATWATSSGGTGSTDNFPLGQDTIIIDDNSGSSLTGSGASAYNTSFAKLDASARTTTFTFTLGTQENIFTGGGAGGITTNSNFVWSGSGIRLVLSGTGAFDLSTPSSFALGSGNLDFIVWKPSGGSVRLLNSVQFTNNTLLRLYAGDLNFNGYTLKLPGRLQISLSGTDTKSTTYGNGGLLELVKSSIDTPLSTADCTYYSVNSDTVTGKRPILVSGNTATAYTSFQDYSVTGVTEANSHDVTITGSSGAPTFWSWQVRDLDVSAATVPGPLWNLFASTFYGSLTLGSGLGSFTGSGVWNFRSTSATVRTITSAGLTVNSPMTFNGVGGSWKLLDALSVVSTQTITLTTGTLDLNGMSVSCGTFTSNSGSSRTLAMGSSTLIITGSGSAWDTSFGTGLAFTSTTGKISFTSASAVTATMPSTSGITVPTINLGGAGAVTISGGSSVTYSGFTNTVSPARVNFPSGLTANVLSFGLRGTAGNLVVVNGVTSAHTLTKTTAGDVDCDYLNITRSQVTGSGSGSGVKWYAGANSTDGGSNTGWIFTAPPAGGDGKFFAFFNWA